MRIYNIEIECTECNSLMGDLELADHLENILYELLDAENIACTVTHDEEGEE